MAQDIAIKIDNRYEVLGELGRGGMGIVYKANDLKMDRLVAIKVMTAHAPGRDEYQERFLREAKSIARMQHPNIVVLFDYGYHAGAPYMAMEYVEGIPLDKVIASRVSLTPLAKVDYIVQVCHALHYAHQQGIIHRDVKPGNIMVLDGGKRIKLLDFGIARAGGASNLSKSGLAMGTTCYMSPEQTKGQKNLDGRADIFSAGVVLYELLAGKPPWTGDSDYEIMTKIIHEPFPPLAGSRNYPADLDQILERCLAKDPNGRYETAEKMAQGLAELETPLKEQALEEALVQFENGDLLRASDLVSQILRIDTRHREAIELQGKLQQIAQLQQRSEQVQQLKAAAEQAIGQKRYTEALSAVDQAISIDSANTELFHYRELIRHEVKRREDIRKKLELAKRAQEINDLSTAEELIDKALEADPTDTQARMMKSSLEQEKKKQQLQEIADETSRALAVRAFARARDFIYQMEALDPGYAPLTSLKKALVEGESEEKRRIEIENLIRDVRRVLESGDVQQSLSITEQALAKFPGETRLLRLRTQAETLRDAAERERAIQEHLAVVKKLVDEGQNAKALATAEGALKRLGVDYRLQSTIGQLRQAVERERQAQAEQVVLAQARSAIQVKDFESALGILTTARTDFPSSKEIQDAWQTAQAGLATQAAAAEQKRQVQAEQKALVQARKAMQAADFDSAVKVLTAAQVDFPQSKEIAETLQTAQTARAKKAVAVERDRQAQAEQAALAQARNAMQAADFESALRTLTAARIDFPNSKELAAALQAAQAGIAQRDELAAENARKREIVASLERALASEPDPELQVRLAEEAVSRVPGNEGAERMLARVRDWRRQFVTAVARAQELEQAQRYTESIQEWQRIKQQWPQHPQVNQQIARLNAILKAEAAPKPPSSAGFSATSIMAAAPRMAPVPPPPAQAAPPPVEKPPQPPAPPRPEAVPSAQVESHLPVDRVERIATVDRSRARLRIQDLIQSKKVLVIAAAAFLVILIFVLTVVLSRKSTPKPVVTNPNGGTIAPGPVVPRPDVGTLTIKSNLDQVDVYVDDVLKPTAEGRELTITVASGPHTVKVQKRGYATPPQPVHIRQDQVSTLQFTLTKSEDTNQPVHTYLIVKASAGAKVRIDRKDAGEAQADGSFSLEITPDKTHHIDVSLDGYRPWTGTASVKAGEKRTVTADLTVIPKPAPSIAFSVNSSNVATIQQGQQVQLRWDVQDATEIIIDQGIGSVRSKDARPVTPTENTTYTLTAKGDGGSQTKSVTVNVAALAKPVIVSFDAGATSIQLGRSVKLFWTSQNAAEAFITSDAGKDVGKVGPQGPVEVAPTKNTTYTLIAKGPGGSSEPRTTQVIVESAPTPVQIVAATPTPAPTPIPVDPEIKAVKETIEFRYKSVLESMLIDEVKKMWVSIPKDVEKDLRGAFSTGARALRVEFSCGTPKVTGDAAECSCSQKFTFTRDNKLQEGPSSRVLFRLTKSSGHWLIVSSTLR